MLIFSILFFYYLKLILFLSGDYTFFITIDYQVAFILSYSSIFIRGAIEVLSNNLGFVWV